MNEADTKAGCRPALIGVCSDENSSFLRGSAGAPPLIRAALFSDAANMWSESGVDLGTDGTFFDAGDIKPSSAEDIENAINGLLARELRPLALGGEQSIAYPIIRAM